MIEIEFASVLEFYSDMSHLAAFDPHSAKESIRIARTRVDAGTVIERPRRRKIGRAFASMATASLMAVDHQGSL